MLRCRMASFNPKLVEFSYIEVPEYVLESQHEAGKEREWRLASFEFPCSL